jgi:hypothetical protein
MKLAPQLVRHNLRAESATQSPLPVTSYPPSFQAIAASLRSFFTRRPLLSTTSTLFLQNTWGGGTSADPSHASLPPSYAPRGASIPCGLSRLRILPVTTGVCAPPTRFRFFCVCGIHNLLALCFHILTNPFSPNPFLFTSMQNPRGGGRHQIASARGRRLDRNTAWTTANQSRASGR